VQQPPEAKKLISLPGAFLFPAGLFFKSATTAGGKKMISLPGAFLSPAGLFFNSATTAGGKKMISLPGAFFFFKRKITLPTNLYKSSSQ
jgi:hypothetical protein